MAQTISQTEVAKHCSQKDCWIIIHGIAYDVTTFLDQHPGGSKIILKYAGKDATAAFDPIHPPDIIEKLLDPSLTKGPVEGYEKLHKNNATKDIKQALIKFSVDPLLPPLNAVLNLNDFEVLARRIMTADPSRQQGWAYYSSAADDEIAARENIAAFSRIFMVPRVMRNVHNIDLSCKILGHESAMPVYVTATALGRLGHPEGEVVLTRAAGRKRIIQMIPTLASCSLEEITSAADGQQIQFFQLYVNSNRAITRNLVQKAERLGCQALFITVDAPVLGKREKDMRMKFINNPPKVQEGQEINKNQGAARAISTFIDPGLEWSDLKWFQSITKMPIILKGVQSAADAILAYEHGVQGVVLSNHGGRQLDYARSGIEILPEVIDALKSHSYDCNKFQVFVDGGIRRGSDVFKAIALGATAVGIGRPLLYAMSTYGQDGVQHALSILQDEMEMVCRLMGVAKLCRDAVPEMLRYRNLSDHLSLVPKNYLTAHSYEKMMSAPLVDKKSKL